jgi:hypothetical protein
MRLRDSLKTKNLLQGDDILPLQVLSLEECEGMLAAVAAGENILTLLSSMGADVGAVGASFVNYHHDRGLSLQPIMHPVLNAARERFYCEMRTIVFGEEDHEARQGDA